MLTEEKIIEIFKKRNAFWAHSGDPKDPHAELTTGLCSNAYFDCSRVLCDPIVCEELAIALCDKLYESGIEDNFPDWVVGSAYAAITFSYEVAKQLGAEHAFAEKTLVPHKMSFKRVEIPEGSVVLQVEELITSLRTVNAVREAVMTQGEHWVEFLPFIGTVVYRPSKLPGNRNIVALVKREVWAAPQEECPLCWQGSVRYRPKENWDELIVKR